MPVFSGANLIGGLLFGSIGFVAFIYGKRMHVWKPMFLGLALMAYPYFVTNDIVLFAIGVVGSATLFLFRDGSLQPPSLRRRAGLLTCRAPDTSAVWVANGFTLNEKSPG